MKQGASIYPEERRELMREMVEKREWRKVVDEFNEWRLAPYRLEYCCGVDYAKFWSKQYLSIWSKDMKGR